MALEEKVKRINFSIPQDLYDRFMDASKKEFMTTSSIVTGWISNYVKEKEQEKANAEQRALQSTLRSLSRIARTGVISEKPSHNPEMLRELEDLLTIMSTDIAACLDIDFQTRIAKLEREYKI